MRTTTTVTLLATLALAAGLGLPAAASCGSPSCTHGDHDAAHAAEHAAGQPSKLAGHALFGPYEAIRQSLIADSVEGVKAQAEKLAASAAALAGDAGSDEVRAELREIAEGAGKLAAAQGLEASREAFYAVSKPLVRYRERVEGERPVVVYCSMADKSWLQPEGPIGNPYYGSSMLRCGQVVSR